VRINPGFEVLIEYPGLDRFPHEEWNWLGYSLTRPLIELTMRRRLERQRNWGVELWAYMSASSAFVAPRAIHTPAFPGARLAGQLASEGNSSRLRTVTCSKRFTSACAAHNPLTPAPITIARLPELRGINPLGIVETSLCKELVRPQLEPK